MTAQKLGAQKLWILGLQESKFVFLLVMYLTRVTSLMIILLKIEDEEMKEKMCYVVISDNRLRADGTVIPTDAKVD